MGVYLTGISNGAMFNYDIGRSALVNRFAAMVPVAGNPHPGFNTDPSLSDYYLSVMDIHGSQDVVVPANVSEENAAEGFPWTSDGAWYYVPTNQVLAKYGEANGCSDALGQPTGFAVP